MLAAVVVADGFDVLAYVRFTLAPLTGSQRADAARATGLSGYEPEMREFLGYVLRAYEAHGIAELAPIKIADFLRIRYGGTNDAKQHRGTVPAIRDAFVGTQVRLFPHRHRPWKIFQRLTVQRAPPPKKGRLCRTRQRPTPQPQAPVWPQLVQKSQPSRRTRVRWAHSGQGRPVSAGMGPGPGASLHSTGAPRAG